MKTNTTGAALYVGTYSKYNSGSLKGAWLNLEDYSGREDFLAACVALHDDEIDPEIMFQDSSDLPGCWYSESSAPPEIVWEWMALDDYERDAFALYANHVGGDTSIDTFRDAYAGTADSEADFAETTATDLGDIPENLPSYIVIDWQATWDCNLRHDYFSDTDSAGNLHFFRHI